VNVASREQQFLSSTQSFNPDQFQVSTAGRPIANDGTAVFSDSHAVVILHGDSVRRISTVNRIMPADATIDPAARSFAYTQRCQCQRQSDVIIDCINPENLTLWVLADILGANDSTMLATSALAPWLADDGSTVLYLSNRGGRQQAEPNFPPPPLSGKGF